MVIQAYCTAFSLSRKIARPLFVPSGGGAPSHRQMETEGSGNKGLFFFLFNHLIIMLKNARTEHQLRGRDSPPTLC